MHSTSSPERRIKTVSDRRRRADDDDDLMPRVPCNDRERRRRAKRGHRPPNEREQTLESSKNRIKIQMGIKRSRGKTRSCNSLELASLHLFIKALLITVAIVAPHQVLTSAADQQGLAPRRQQQIAKQQPDDRWFRGTLIIVPEDNYGAGVFPSLAGDEMSYEQPIDEPIFLRRRRHGPPSQDEFAAPTQDNNQEQDSESRDDDQPTADGGNQFDSEHSAAAASSLAMADDDNDDHRASTSSQKLKMTTNATSKQQAAAAAANNKTELTCDTLEDVEASRPPRTFGMILAVGYGVIFVLGLIGNVITLYVLWCKGKKRTAQDVLVANLAISDVLLCVFCVPIMPKYLIIDGYWTLGLVFCKVVSFAQSTSVYMSTYSLIYIGWIRYKLIVHPLENKKWVTQKGYALIACALTWTTAITLTVPYTSKVRLAPQECEIMFCDEDWEAKNWRFLFSLFTTVFQFIIPLAAVGFFNRKIYARLDERAGGSHSHPHSQNHNNHVAPNLSARKSIVATTTTTGGGGSASLTGKRAGVGIEPEAHTVAGESHLYNYVHHNVRPPPLASREPPQSNDVLALKEFKQREKNRRMQKANNRLIFVVVVFAHSWLPLNLFNMIQDYFEELGHWKYLTTTFLVVHQIACSSVIWNPILYAWMSETYRSELRAALPKFLVAKLSSCLSDGPTGGGAVGQHHHNVGGAHGPASTSICALHPNNNNTNGHHDHRRSSNLTNNGQHQTKSHMNLNQQPLQMLHTELAKARSIDHISKVRNELQPADCCRDHDHDDEIHRSEIILTRNNNNNNNNSNDNEDMTGGGRISPGVVSSD